MAKLNTLADLLVQELQDLHSAETQLLKALPKMADAADSEELAAGFNEHFEQTQIHVARLQHALEALGAATGGKPCKAMQGLIAEGEEIIREEAEPPVHDAALISIAQKVEHYEIAGYGTARTFATLLGHDEVAEILQRTLDEESATDRKLTAIAESINEAASVGLDAPEDE